MALNQATKYGLFFVGGIAVGALGMALVSRGKLNIKPLATDLLASGIDLRDKALAAVDGVKEDLADVVAEAQVKQQEKKELILGRMPFDTEYYPLLDNEEGRAAKEMWKRMWTNRKDKRGQ